MFNFTAVLSKLVRNVMFLVTWRVKHERKLREHFTIYRLASDDGSVAASGAAQDEHAINCFRNSVDRNAHCARFLDVVNRISIEYHVKFD